jgi:SAM-dependent methyltransferase
VLELEQIACPLCGEGSATTLFEQRDFALGVPGRYSLVRCPRCGLLYQNPRIRMDQLELAYPANYPPHTKDPEISRVARRLGPAGRRVLARRLGYRHLDPGELPLAARLRTAVTGRRVVKAFVPWVGQGRLLDVGCAMGRFMGLMQSVGWTVSGIEIDPDAAARARQVTPRVFHGDPMDAPFAPGSFDLVTAFHVLEHLPDPVGVLRRMLGWLAPGGIVVVEVPNVSGVGGRVFGHLVQFTPETMGLLAERAGGRVVAAEHKTKPRYLIRSLRFALDDYQGHGARLARTLVDSRLGGGVLKLLLELTLPIARPLRLGEAVRYVIEPMG